MRTNNIGFVPLDRVGRKHFQHIQPNICAAPGRTLADLLGSLDADDSDGHLCPFGNFKNTVMERKKCSCFASGTFRIDAYTDLPLLKKCCSFLNGNDCIARIAAVNRKKAAFADNRAEKGNTEIGWLGYESDIS